MNVNTVKMRFIDTLCPPALLYLLFVTIQVALDISLGHVITAGIKIATGVVGVVILDALCGVDLGVVSWFIIATPFVVTSLATAIALGLDIDKRAQTKVKEAFSLSPAGTSDKDPVVVTMAEQEPVDYPFSTNAPIQK
jgi:hypothetical protein